MGVSVKRDCGILIYFYKKVEKGFVIVSIGAEKAQKKTATAV